MLHVDIDQIEDGTLEEVADEGVSRGAACASWIDTPEYGIRVPTHIADSAGVTRVLSQEDAAAVMTELARNDEFLGRQGDEFDAVVLALASRDDYAEAWDAFANGVDQGIAENIAERDLSFGADYSLCQDCHDYERTGDPTFLDGLYNQADADQQQEAMDAGMARLPSIVPLAGQVNELSHDACDCCGTTLAGNRYEYAKSPDFSPVELAEQGAHQANTPTPSVTPAPRPASMSMG